MRVVLNGWFLQAPATGTGQYLRHLAGALSRLTAESRDESALIAAGTEPDIQAELVHAAPRLPGNPGKVEFEQLTFPRACARGRFELAHVPYFGPPLNSPVPAVVTIHDLIPLILPAYRGSPLVRAYTALASIGARRARAIIADSEASRRDIVERLRIPPPRVRVVYLAAGPEFHPAEPEEIARVRAKYKLPNRFILYLGGYDVRKNVPLLVEAFNALRDEQASGCKLVLAGQIPPASAFFPNPLQRAGPLVQSIGPVAEEDKRGLYGAASAFAYPSLYEGFGLPPLEAMACGTPVVCSNSSSLPEVVGDAGMLVDPTCPGDWTASLGRMLGSEELRREKSVRGMERACRFSWERTARETLEAYRSALI